MDDTPCESLWRSTCFHLLPSLGVPSTLNISRTNCSMILPHAEMAIQPVRAEPEHLHFPQAPGWHDAAGAQLGTQECEWEALWSLPPPPPRGMGNLSARNHRFRQMPPNVMELKCVHPGAPEPKPKWGQWPWSPHSPRHTRTRGEPQPVEPMCSMFWQQLLSGA